MILKIIEILMIGIVFFFVQVNLSLSIRKDVKIPFPNFLYPTIALMILVGIHIL